MDSADQQQKVPKLSSLKKNFDDWDVGSNYEIIKQIGSGSYGYVVEAIQKQTGQKVAIKRVNNLFEDLIDCKRILREISLLTIIDHPNLIKIIDIIEPKDWQNFDTIYLIFEYCQSDLKKLLKSPIHLQLVHIQTLTYNILIGLKYLHSAEVLHRDLKPANVLINEDCSVKICDFGLARSVEGIEGAHIYDKDKQEQQQQQPLAVSTAEDNSIAKASDKKGKLKKQTYSKNVKRELTGHVVTRWYRAPELILLEKDYTSAIDIWSVGCIFAELMNMMKENAETFLDRSPLFPGSSCFPLSPDSSNKQKKGGFPHSQTDQLTVIFSVIGTPNEEEVGFVTDDKAIEYLKSFNKKERTDFKLLYPGATAECIDFLQKTIQFDPRKRISVEEALNHPLFSNVRDKKKEIVSKGPVVLEFEKEKEMDQQTLKELFVQTIKKFQKNKK